MWFYIFQIRFTLLNDSYTFLFIVRTKNVDLIFKLVYCPIFSLQLKLKFFVHRFQPSCHAMGVEESSRVERPLLRRRRQHLRPPNLRRNTKNSKSFSFSGRLHRRSKRQFADRRDAKDRHWRRIVDVGPKSHRLHGRLVR